MSLGAVPAAPGVEAAPEGDRSLASGDVDDALFQLKDDAQVEFAVKSRIWSTVEGHPSTDAALAVAALDAPSALVTATLELLPRPSLSGSNARSLRGHEEPVVGHEA
jgi:hypothetical protein